MSLGTAESWAWLPLRQGDVRMPLRWPPWWAGIMHESNLLGWDLNSHTQIRETRDDA